MNIKEEVLDQLIKEARSKFDHHLNKMTKFEQRMNVLESLKAEKTSKYFLN